MASFADILGGLGDALSVGNGGKANYQDRQDDMAFEKGFGKYQENPDGPGLAAMMGIDRAKAIDFSQNQDLARYQRGKNAIDQLQAQTAAGTAGDKKDEMTIKQLVAMAQTARPDNWDMLGPHMKQYAQARGFGGALDIPDKYEDGFGLNFSNRYLEPKERGSLEESHNYHEATTALEAGRLKVSAAQEQGRNDRFNAHEGNMRDNNNANRPIAQQNANTREGSANERARHNAVQEAASSGRFHEGQKVRKPDGKGGFITGVYHAGKIVTE